MGFEFGESDSSIARTIALVAAGVAVGAAVSLLYDGPFEAGLGPAIGVLTIAVAELSRRR